MVDFAKFDPAPLFVRIAPFCEAFQSGTSWTNASGALFFVALAYFAPSSPNLHRLKPVLFVTGLAAAVAYYTLWRVAYAFALYPDFFFSRSGGGGGGGGGHQLFFFLCSFLVFSLLSLSLSLSSFLNQRFGNVVLFRRHAVNHIRGR
jgi:hypothetical protein